MRHFAVVGSGPAGFYTAEALEKAYGDEARIDILDRYPVPYGLIRFGVAPDHQSLKAVSKRYDKVAESAGRRLHRQCHRRPRRLGRRAARALRRGDPRHRRAARPQARHSGRGPARRHRLGRVRRLVQRPSRFRRPRPAARRHPRGGHRQRQCRARLRAHPVEDARTSSKARTSSAMRSTRSTLGDPDHHHPRPPRPAPDRDDAQGTGRARPSRSRGAGRRPRRLSRRSKPTSRSSPASASRSRLLRDFADLRREQAQAHDLRFLRQAGRDRGRRQGRADRSSSGPSSTRRARRAAPARPTKCRRRWSSAAIGYSTPPIDGVPYDERGGKFLNDDGRSPTGSTRSAGRGAGRPGRSAPTAPTAMKSPTRSPPRCRREARQTGSGAEGLKRLLEERGVMPTDYDDWRKIEETETGRARPGSPREKFVRQRIGSDVGR